MIKLILLLIMFGTTTTNADTDNDSIMEGLQYLNEQWGQPTEGLKIRMNHEVRQYNKQQDQLQNQRIRQDKMILRQQNQQILMNQIFGRGY